MFEVGDALGEGFVITRIDPPIRPGVFVELRDAGGATCWAQCLHASSFSAAEVARLAREVKSVPASGSVFVPSQIVATTSGQPFAIHASRPPALVVDALDRWRTSGDVHRRKDTALRFMRAFAVVAEDYGRALGGRSAHGAITLQSLGFSEAEPVGRFVLMDFGVEMASRVSAKASDPMPGADTAALTLALHDLMQRTGALPFGEAASRWDMLRNCARGGGHPALKSGVTLAGFLRELAKSLE